MNTVFPRLAGIIEIALAAFCLGLSIIFLMIVITYPQSVSISQLGLIAFGFVASLLGLIGGVFALKLERFNFVLIGVISLLCWSILFGWNTVSIFISYDFSFSASWSQDFIITSISIVVSIIALIFLLVSKRQFYVMQGVKKL